MRIPTKSPAYSNFNAPMIPISIQAALVADGHKLSHVAVNRILKREA